jgi:hypothetical protein
MCTLTAYKQSRPAAELWKVLATGRGFGGQMVTHVPAPRHTALRRQWRQLTQALNDPHLELTVEEFAPILSTFKLLRDAGERSDPMLMALMAALERQAMSGDESDADNDRSDDEESEQPATGYSTTASGTSDECYDAMLERQRQERIWGKR